jgi:hypothetical protein
MKWDSIVMTTILLALFPGKSSKRSGAAEITIYVIFNTSSQEKQPLDTGFETIRVG